MKKTNLLFHLCRIYIDETEFQYQGTKHFLLGGLFLPVDCNLSENLGKARMKNLCINTLHFSERTNISGKKFKTMLGFIIAFAKSNAIFRSILINSNTWNRWDSDHQSRARLAALLLSWPWIPHRGLIHNRLSGARIFFDRQSLNTKQEDEFRSTLNYQLARKNEVLEESTKKLKDATIFFAPTDFSCELQLTDILLGIIRTSYQIHEGKEVSPSRISLHDRLLKEFPQIKDFVEANRTKTRQKINVWHKSDIINP